jgi:hypothetical protein
MANSFEHLGAVAVNVLAKCEAQPEVPIHPRYPAVAHALAYHLARRAVEREVQAQGKRRPWAEIITLTRAYHSAHPELLAQAAEMVRGNPTLTAMAERQERQRQREHERQRRKRARAGIIENPCRSVS